MVFVSPRAIGPQRVAATSQLSVWFCKALNRLPFLLSPPFSVSASRYFKAVPRAPSRVLDREIGPRSRVPTLHLFRRSFAVGRARFPFQMSSSLEPFRHSSRSPSTVVVHSVLFSLILLLSRRLLPVAADAAASAAAVASLLFPGQPRWFLNYVVRPSVPVAWPKRLSRDEEQCISVLPRVLSLIDN